MYIATTISVFGWMSARRIFSNWCNKKLISGQLFFLADVVLLLLSILPLIFGWSDITCGTYFLGLMFFQFLVPFWIEWSRRQQFNLMLISAMDAILLSLRAGRSFRDSLAEISSGEVDYGFYMKEIVTVVLLRQSLKVNNTDVGIQRVYLELKAADQSLHRIADRIKSFRYQLKVEENFKQKSRMATLQARAQSVVVGILYFFALIFSFSTFSKNLDIKIVGTSFLLFSLGTVWIWKLGRTHQWKV